MDFCHYTLDGDVATLTITRPEVLNALHPAGHDAMAAAFDRYALDDGARVLIVTGAGDRAFCVGTDLQALAVTGDHRKPATGFAGITHRFNLFKPVIAAVNGLCLGGGLEIVAACDLAIASDGARFGLPEPRAGLAALGGGLLQRLPRQITMKDAMWLVLTGLPVDAHEAQRMGLINRVVPHGDLLAAARGVAETLLECAPLALQASKQVMLQSLELACLEEAIVRTYTLAERMLQSDDAVEGPKAFAEKRKPRWRGR